MLSSNTSAVSGDTTYIEDVFSTYLYTGNGSTQTITNNIDLSTKGGMVWAKARNSASGGHYLYDTARGVQKYINSASTSGNTTDTTGLTAFNATGFSLGNSGDINVSARTYASWTFRKQPKFFDVVTYTGNETIRTIAHNLGSVPGCILIKRTSSAADWVVYHRSTGPTKFLRLNTTGAAATDVERFNDTAPTSTEFTLGIGAGANGTGETYVAYLFAHDAGGFGLTGTDNVISCGSFTTDSGSNASVTLGYEPQFVLIKQINAGGGSWIILDNMRGMSQTQDSYIFPNSSSAEGSWNPAGLVPTATGFNCVNGVLNSSATSIYIAIRRGPMKVPTDGTKVFSPYTATLAAGAQVPTSFPVDMIYGLIRGGGDHDILDRLRSIANTAAVSPYLKTDSTAAEATAQIAYNADRQDGFKVGSFYGGASTVWYSFKRAPSFFDEVCYTGTGSAQTQSHNLGAVPELMIVKRRNLTASWGVYSAALGNTKMIELNSTGAVTNSVDYWNSTTPTSSVFSIGGSDTAVNASGSTYVNYLFATCAGVSKVGSYTGTGTTKQVDCGFAAGARFVLIKRTDSTGDWYVWDTARGIVSGNDPYLLLNSTAAETTTTDYIDTYSAGFELSSTAPAALNASGGTYIFLAIA